MMSKKRSAEKTVRDIRRATRRHYSAEEKIRIVLEGLRGEDSTFFHYILSKKLHIRQVARLYFNLEITACVLH